MMRNLEFEKDLIELLVKYNLIVEGTLIREGTLTFKMDELPKLTITSVVTKK